MLDHGTLPRHHTPESHAVDPEPKRGAARVVALMVLCLCALTTGLDMTITNIALPFIGKELRASTSELQWIVDLFNIITAGLLVLGGGIADRVGRKKVFLAGYTLFGLGTLWAAFSGSAGELIAARGVMGAGAAFVLSPSLAILSTLYPPEERRVAIAVWATFGATGLALGPVLGGFLLDAFWWGSVFLVTFPIVATGVIVGLWVIPESRKPTEGRLDIAAGLLSVVGLSAVLFGVIEGPERGWTDPLVIGGLVLGAAALVAFVVREARADDPLFDVRVMTRRVVAGGALTLFIAYFVFASMLFLVPQYLQLVLQESTIAVGLLLLPFAVAFGVASLTLPGPAERLPAGLVLPVGLALCALSMTLLGVWADAEAWAVVVATLVLSVGLALLVTPGSTAVMNDLPPVKAGEGSSINMVSRMTGASVGVALIGTIYAASFTSTLQPALASLPAGEAALAESSISGADTVADSLPAAAGEALRAAAGTAFSDASRLAYWVAAAVTAAVALLVAWALRKRRPAVP